MALELSTAGITVEYVACTTIDEIKTPDNAHTAFTGGKKITGITAIPEINPSPSNLDVTDLSDLEFKRYIPGLKDIGSAVALTMNFNNTNCSGWNAMCTSCNASGTIGLYRYTVPKMGYFYYAGIPETVSFPEVSVDSVFQGNVYITPNAIFGWKFDENATVTETPSTETQG